MVLPPWHRTHSSPHPDTLNSDGGSLRWQQSRRHTRTWFCCVQGQLVSQPANTGDSKNSLYLRIMQVQIIWDKLTALQLIQCLNISWTHASQGRRWTVPSGPVVVRICHLTRSFSLFRVHCTLHLVFNEMIHTHSARQINAREKHAVTVARLLARKKSVQESDSCCDGWLSSSNRLCHNTMQCLDCYMQVHAKTIMAKLSPKDMLAAVAALSVPQPVSKHVSCLTSPRTHTPRSNSGGAASTTASDAFKQAAIAVSKKAPKGRAKPAAQQQHQKQPRQTAAATAAAPAQAHSPSLWPTDGALDMIKAMIALDAAATGVSNITQRAGSHIACSHNCDTAPPYSTSLVAAFGGSYCCCCCGKPCFQSPQQDH